MRDRMEETESITGAETRRGRAVRATSACAHQRSPVLLNTMLNRCRPGIITIAFSRSLRPPACNKTIAAGRWRRLPARQCLSVRSSKSAKMVLHPINLS